MSRHPTPKTLVRRRPTFRPWLESLEDRVVPSNASLLTPTPAVKLDASSVNAHGADNQQGGNNHAVVNLSGGSVTGGKNHGDNVALLFGNEQGNLSHGNLKLSDSTILAFVLNGSNDSSALDRLFSGGRGGHGDNGDGNSQGEHFGHIPPGQLKKLEREGFFNEPTTTPVVPVHVVVEPPENPTTSPPTTTVAIETVTESGGGAADTSNVAVRLTGASTSSATDVLSGLARVAEDVRNAVASAVTSGTNFGQGGDSLDSLVRRVPGLSNDGGPEELDDTTELTTLSYNLDVMPPNDALAADDLARSLLTGGARADVLPQQGSSIASVGTLLGSDGTTPRGDEANEASPLQQFLINPLHATPPAHAAPSAPASRNISHALEWEKFLVRWSPLLLAPLVGWVTSRIRRANDKLKQIA
jgi:hypothetical protein